MFSIAPLFVTVALLYTKYFAVMPYTSGEPDYY